MRETTLRATDMMLLAGTRVALGVGIGLLAAGRLHDRSRRGAGLALVIVGALTTVPIVLNAFASSTGRFEGARGGAGRSASAGARREGAQAHEQPAVH
jgi:hypothetical protein